MKNKSFFHKLIAGFAAVILWQILALMLGENMLVASPIDVIKELPNLLSEGGFYLSVLYSVVRICGGFLLKIS